MSEERKPIGKITRFFPKISVAVLKADETIKKGDKISIGGHGKKVEMVLESMQSHHTDVEEIKQGEEVGIKTPEDVKEGDLVYKAD
ncbi:translation elongation factor-like protein [Candidatus Woesearchaeota archaeon]|nr:translation elongation factor-like protein [Candidatus Woesearchaeota archaeon]